MSDQDLRDLLHDQVADVTTTDLASDAWRRAVRRRRRRTAGAVGGAALTLVLIAGGVVAITDRGHRDAQPAPQLPTPTEATPVADAEYQDLPVWWSPDLDEELELPWIAASPLPREIDLTADIPDLADEPIDRAVAAFAGPVMRDVDTVVLVTADRELRRVDVSELEPWDDAGGNPYSVATASMLAPDGRRLVFPQDGHLMVYDLAADEWTRIDTGTAETAYVAWVDADTLLLPRQPERSGPIFDVRGERTGSGQKPAVRVFQVQDSMQNPVGPAHSFIAGESAQSWGMGPGIPVREPAAYLSGPAHLVVTGGPGPARVLAFMTGIDDVRWMDAPPVAGWLDADTVVYESIAEDRDLLIAWDVGTHTFRRVMSATPGWQSSFARLYS
jgi:hypothetical protein